MGFDCTFHPISADQLRHFLFDVIEDSGLAADRAREITTNKKYQQAALTLYRAIPQWISAKAPVDSTIAFSAAILAGFLHPYWYARGQALSFLAEKDSPELAELFQPLAGIGPSVMQSLRNHEKKLIRGNASASGFIAADRIERVQRILQDLSRPDRRESPLKKLFDAEGLQAIQSTLDYCRTHNLGLIEVSDVVVPIAGQCLSNSANLRGNFLDEAPKKRNKK